MIWPSNWNVETLKSPSRSNRESKANPCDVLTLSASDDHLPRALLLHGLSWSIKHRLPLPKRSNTLSGRRAQTVFGRTRLAVRDDVPSFIPFVESNSKSLARFLSPTARYQIAGLGVPR